MKIILYIRNLINQIRTRGFINGIENYFAVASRIFLMKYWRSRADYLVSIRKGKCKQCGKCCPDYCEYKKDNKCTIYDIREDMGHLLCVLAPLPLDLKIGKFKNLECGFYYGVNKNVD